MVLVTLVLVGIISLIVWSYIEFKRSDRRSNIPGPSPWPILGNGYAFLGDTTYFLSMLGKLRDVCGDLYRVYILHKRLYVVTDVKHMEVFLSSNEFITKGEIYRYLYPWLGHGGLLTSTGSRWRSHRKLLTPAFHFNILQSFFKVFLKNNKYLIKKLMEVADGRVVDVFPIVALTALDNVAECAMGVPINSQSESDSAYVQAIEDISEVLMTRMFSIITSNDFLFTFTSDYRRQQKALKILHHHTNTVIKNRMDVISKNETKMNMPEEEYGTKERYTFLDLLLLSEVDGKRMDFVEIREEVDTFLFAGHDTTAAALSNIMFCLSRNPVVQETLFNEVKSTYRECDESELKYRDLQNMKYLDLVIKESLRLYAPVPIIGRLIHEDVEIHNFKYLKGSTAILSLYYMMRDPKVFEDPLEFKPERFMAEDLKNHFSWLVFSAGPRNCIGQRFAMMELKVVIASVVKNFKLLPVEYEPQLGADLVLRAKNGMNVKFMPRT